MKEIDTARSSHSPPIQCNVLTSIVIRFLQPLSFLPCSLSVSFRSARDNYQKLLDGSTMRDLAPKASSYQDPNRLSGSARRFAMQMIISKKLDERDKAKSKGQKIIQKPDYKQRLEEQIQLKRQQQEKAHAKAAKRAAGGAGGQNNNAPSAGSSQSTTTPSKSAPAVTPTSELTPSSTPSSKSGVISLSKSIEQQRQAKRDRKAHAESKYEVNAEQKALEAAEAKAAAAAAAAASNPDGTDEPKTMTAKAIFSTEMRPGESFRSYQARLVAEKSKLMNAEVVAAPKGLSEKKKRKLDEKEQKRKEKKSTTLDPIERRVREEREAKDRLDAERGLRTVKLPDHEGRAKEFDDLEPIEFGDVAERPPQLTVLPKSKTLSNKLDTDRIIDGLLLLQEQKRRKAGQPAMDALEKAEWISKQRDVTRIQQMAAEAKEKELEALREQSLAAYKASKKRRREEEADAKLAEAGKDKPYVKKSVLKKQKRNRERMQAFKDQQDLELDMEIEMADDYD